ncbi:MAG TPA: molybdenum cofactor guanylyltransferase [Bacteroidales bacterium]|nr:molybdenum cofactor guanylyltransferase [Bacteroidales bacterium]
MELTSTGNERITGIVLAGGKSSRMGTDKALLLYKGMPLVTHAVSLLSQVCSKVIISANKTEYAFTGCEVFPDEFSINASMAGIWTALLHSITEWNLVLSCDMPLIDPGFMRSMLDRKAGYDVVVPVHEDGSLEPLCALYNKRVIDGLNRCLSEGQYSMRDFIMQSTYTLIHTGSSRPMFLNVNTEQDFILLNKS